jgi:hypothetical protein
MLTVEKSAIKAHLDAPKRQSTLEIEGIQKNLATKVMAAKAKMASLATEDSNAILEVVRDMMEEIVAQLPEQHTEIEPTIAAAIGGIIRGIIIPKRSAIAELQKQIQILQAKKEEEQQTLQSQIESIGNVIKDTGKTESASIRKAIESAIEKSLAMCELLFNKD